MSFRIAISTPIGLALSLAAASCGTGSGDDARLLSQETLGAAEAAVVCVTLRRAASGAVEDAVLTTDPADPSRAISANGASVALGVGTTGTAVRESLIRFDLSPVPDNVPITSADLVLKKVSSLGPGPVELHRITAPWSEGTVTWSSFGQAYDATVEATLSPPAIGTSPVSVPVTALMQSWNQGVFPNEGVALTEPTGGRAAFGASEGPAGSRPQLVVCYSPPTCSDGLQNQGETAVDCDGPCAPCVTACTGVVCLPLDGCHVAGVCDPQTGQCSQPPAADGTPCDDGDVCTPGDTCQLGLCVGSTPPPCVTADGCHPGTCDPATGGCVGLPFSALALGSINACGLAPDGAPSCWGDDSYGQSTPPAGMLFAETRGGNYHTCGILLDGTVTCWGANDRGQTNSPGGLFVHLGTGSYHTCGVLQDGTLSCWGFNPYGQATPPVGTFTAVDGGGAATCGLRTDGTITCWGHPNLGNTNAPPGTFVDLTVGTYHSCALRADGTLACWGNNQDGQATPPAGTFTEVRAGAFHTCGLRPDGTITCWGNSAYGALAPPAGVFVRIDVGVFQSCALSAAGSVTCWGTSPYPSLAPAPSGPTLANGTVCDDGDACTLSDTCQSGACVPTSLVSCLAPDVCHAPGLCDPASGTCGAPLLSVDLQTDPNHCGACGNVCADGTCVAGGC